MGLRDRIHNLTFNELQKLRQVFVNAGLADETLTVISINDRDEIINRLEQYPPFLVDQAINKTLKITQDKLLDDLDVDGLLDDLSVELRTLANTLAGWGEGLGIQALEIMQGIGIAALSGAEKTFDYTYSKISPHRVEAVSVMTAMMVYLTTAVIVFKKIKGAN